MDATNNMNKTPNLSLRNISKAFNIGFRRRRGVLEQLSSLVGSREQKKRLDALRSVSLDVMPGEIIGIIGSNGSGKSTMLRIMAGIYEPDAGIIDVKGRVISIINLGTGLMERLPMRDNIFLIGSLFGMSNATVRDRFDSIVAFSGLAEFVDTKIYQFSAGMMQRLSFSIAIHADPDILLLDEVFEVGDEDFRKKSSARIKELAQSGSSIVLVSHDLELIKRNCSKVYEMRHGELKLAQGL